MKFDRIWIKVFLIIAILNVSLTLAAYLFSMWSFDASLNQFIVENRRERLTHLADRLAGSYSKYNGWKTLVDNPALVERLIFDTVADDLPRAPGSRPYMPSSPGGRNRHAFNGYFLLGADGKRLLGKDALPPDGLLIPIRSGNDTIGYLGAPPALPVPPSILMSFAEKQRQGFLLIALGMFGASIIGAFGIARWFGRSIDEFARGTRNLIMGDCSTRITYHGQDELGQLAQNFNTLAGTLAFNHAARRDLMASIAHELQTPLTVMLGEVEAVEDGIHQNDDEWLRRIGQRIRQLSLQVNDLRQLALSDKAVLVAKNERLNLADLVEEFLESNSITFTNAGLQVDKVISKHVLMHGDRVRMHQLLCNLMQNSLRYTTMPGILRVRVWREKSKVFMTWEDSAPGVPSASLDHLTDRLYRGSHSHAHAEGGLGLGLWIAKTIIEYHDGTMQASHSELGGLCWTLEMPCFAPELEYA